MGSSVGNVASVLFDPLDLTNYRHNNKKKDLLNDLGTVSRPDAPVFNSLQNPNGTLKSAYRFGNFTPLAQRQAQSALNRLRGVANSTGVTDIGQRQLSRLDQANTNSLNDIARRTQSNLTGQLDSLASRGGLSGGARERLAARNLRSNQSALQDQRNQFLQKRLGILENDENRKFSILQNLPAQLRAQAGLDIDKRRFDIANAINNNTLQNKFNLGRYAELMKEFGANREARLQAKNLPKGGLGGVVNNIFGGIF